MSHARIYLFQGKAEKLNHVLELLIERYQYQDSELVDPGFYPATFGSPTNEKLLDALTDDMFGFTFIELSEHQFKRPCRAIKAMGIVGAT